MKKHKQYYLSAIYQGYQVYLTCMAHSFKEAAAKFDSSVYHTRNYASCVSPNDEYFEGVRAQIDSGFIIFDHGRTDLMRKYMPYDELKQIISYYVSLKYNTKS